MHTPDTMIPWEQRKTVRPREIAQYTGISATTVYDAIRRGELPATRISPKVLIVQRRDADVWLALKRNGEEA